MGSDLPRMNVGHGVVHSFQDISIEVTSSIGSPDSYIFVQGQATQHGPSVGDFDLEEIGCSQSRWGSGIGTRDGADIYRNYESAECGDGRETHDRTLKYELVANSEPGNSLFRL